MSNDKKSVMKSVKNGFRSMRFNKKKNKKVKQTKDNNLPAVSTPALFASGSTASLDKMNNDNMHFPDRKGSWMSFNKPSPSASSKQYNIQSPSAKYIPHRSSFSSTNKPKHRTQNSYSFQPKKHRKNDSVLNMTKLKATTTTKLKASNKYTLDFNIPQLYLQKNKPFPASNVPSHASSDLYTDDDNVVVIPISIDIEDIYNTQYDNNYNRKVLGPLKPVVFPLLIDSGPIVSNDNNDNDITQLDAIESDYTTSSSSDGNDDDDDDSDDIAVDRDQLKPLKQFVKPMPIKGGRRHRRSRSNPIAPPVHLLKIRTPTTGVDTDMLKKNNNKHKYKKKRKKKKKKKNWFRKRVKFNKNNNKSSKKDNNDYVNLKFKNKYDKKPFISPDEIEILARRLLNVNADNYNNNFNKKNKLHNIHYNKKASYKKKQNNNLLQNNVFKKSECIVFGLQLIDSLKQITTNLTRLFENFSDGLNDLLRICKEFIELIINPLPRQVYNDYNNKISEYEGLVKIISSMSSSFYDSSLAMRETIPTLSSALSSNINNRINEYTTYCSNIKSADRDINTLNIHCDRTLRRLFRSIPKPPKANNNSNIINRQKSIKQNKNIRIFGNHYVATNSNAHICRSVPSRIRDGIIQNYVHYLTLIDSYNINTENYYNSILPAISIEFEESEIFLKKQTTNALKEINNNLPTKLDIHKGKYCNKNKPHIEYSSSNYIKLHHDKRIKEQKVYTLYNNALCASPMNVSHTMDKIADYILEENEKKTYDEFEIIFQKKKEKKLANGTFSLKNYSDKFDSATFINQEIIQNFFQNHYYHLGDILFEIPDLYSAFENYLKIKLSVENLYFLREIDDIYFNQINEFNRYITIKETKIIYNKFIDDKSLHQVNLPGNIFKKLKKDINILLYYNDPMIIFDKSYECISSLIHKESLPNFYKSEYFKIWYEKQRQINEKVYKKERKNRAK